MIVGLFIVAIVCFVIGFMLGIATAFKIDDE